METIYIDSLFLLNLIIDYLICLLSARVCGLRLRRLRYLAAAALGGAYSVAMYLPGLEWLALWPMKLCLWLAMALTAYGSEERMLRCGVVFLAVSAAFGGFMWAIELSGRHPAFDLRTMLLAFVLCYALLRLIFGGRARLAEARRVNVLLELDGRQVELTALVDSGNRLRDPVSGLPVMIVSPHALSPLFPGCGELLRLEPVALMESMGEMSPLRGRLRLIPFSSLGGHGLLCAFRPDRAEREGTELEIMAAISKDASGDGFQAII